MNRFPFVLLGVLLASVGGVPAQIPADPADPADSAGRLPFSLTITEEPMAKTPDYMGPSNPCDMDFPFCPVQIDGEFWVFYKNGYKNEVFRFKGTNIEDCERQPDGAAQFPLTGGAYMLGGMWYDAETKKLYAPLHCEVLRYNGCVEREIHLAMSLDKGLTWQYEGVIMASHKPNEPRLHPTEYSGLTWDGGDGDFILYVDKDRGFFYLFTNHYTWSKTGATEPMLLRHCVARCAIRDKMAPGKWQKFYEGEWSEPALGGKASYVNGSCVTYNTALGLYLSIDCGYLAFCTDLAKQDWSPLYRLEGDWMWGNWATDDNKTGIYSAANPFHFYSFWQSKPGRHFRMEVDTQSMSLAKAVVQGGNNAAVTGVGLKVSADTYRASDCFSSVQGKNQWSQLQVERGEYAPLVFDDPLWKGAEKPGEIGYFHMTPGSADVLRRWSAPRAGVVRLEGRVASAGKESAGVYAEIRVNGKAVWPKHLVKRGEPASYDLQQAVKAGDIIDFIVNQNTPPANDSAEWDPVVTYLDGQVP